MYLGPVVVTLGKRVWVEKPDKRMQAWIARTISMQEVKPNV